jgi:hypothetical protein
VDPYRKSNILLAEVAVVVGVFHSVMRVRVVARFGRGHKETYSLISLCVRRPQGSMAL